jgi:WD40 repeat protein
MVLSVAFAPTTGLLASGSTDKTVRLWDPATGTALRTLEGHTSSVWSVAFAPTTGLLASGSADNTVRLWDPATGTALRTLEGHTNSVWSVAFAPTTGLLASGSQDNTVRLWDPATGRCLALFLATPQGWVALSPDGRYKLGGDVAGHFWNAINLCRFDPPPPLSKQAPPLPQEDPGLSPTLLAPDGRPLRMADDEPFV